MPEKKFTYSDPKFLNNLVMLISETKCDFSAELMPDIPELIEWAAKARTITVESPAFPDLDKILQEKQLNRDQMHALVMLKLCEKYQIMPLLAFKFDYLTGGRLPEIKYLGPHLDRYVPEEPYKTCIHPAHFATGNRWYKVIFDDVSGEENIVRAKQAIAGFIDKEYVVTYLSAELEPYISRGEYFDYKESKARMFASEGIITIFGEIPEDFSFDNIKELKPDTKKLSEPPKLLDGLIKRLEEPKG